MLEDSEAMCKSGATESEYSRHCYKIGSMTGQLQDAKLKEIARSSNGRRWYTRV